MGSLHAAVRATMVRTAGGVVADEVVDETTLTSTGGTSGTVIGDDTPGGASRALSAFPRHSTSTGMSFAPARICGRNSVSAAACGARSIFVGAPRGCAFVANSSIQKIGRSRTTTGKRG